MVRLRSRRPAGLAAARSGCIEARTGLRLLLVLGVCALGCSSDPTEQGEDAGRAASDGGWQSGPGGGGDVDECALGIDECDRDPPASCRNGVVEYVGFPYRCTCPPGTSDPETEGRNCEPIVIGGDGGGVGSGGAGGTGSTPRPAECGANNGGCSSLVTCNDEAGFADCGECPEGTEDANGDGTMCRDIDECALGTDECDDDPEASCTNGGLEFVGFRYRCRCPAGTADSETGGRNCESTDGSGGTGGDAVDECAMELDECDSSPSATCDDTADGYTCTCPIGYEDPSTEGRNCVDIDECARGLDECDDAPAATCEDTTGSYTCSCPTGYEDPVSSGADCVEIDECSLGIDDCDSEPDACVDELNAFSCACPSGYTDVHGDGSDCQDINECDLGTDQCDESPLAPCENTVGSYDCLCPAGYSDVLGTGSHCVPFEDRIAVGEAHSCAIQTGGVVKCWGYGNHGALGTGSTEWLGVTPETSGENLIGVDLGAPAIAIAAGCWHNCALLVDGTVKCWGRNVSPPDDGGGQLGTNDSDNRGDGPGEMGANLVPVPIGGTATQIATGCEYSCALLQGGSLKCWGGNRWGQLGRDHGDSLGDGEGEMEALTPIDLSGTVTHVWAGFRFACAQIGSQIKCWGRNQNGQLGLGDKNHRGDGLDAANNPLGEGVSEMGSSLPFVDLDSALTLADYTGGFVHACARFSNDSLKCWGGSVAGIGYGEVGLNVVDRGDEAGEMGVNLPAIVGLPGTPIGFSASTHTCVVLAGGGLACFGANNYGKLGLGDLDARTDEPGEVGTGLLVDLGEGAIVVAVRAGSSHTCALLDTGEVKCWGRNFRGQLGLGDTDDRGDEPDEMGTALGTALDLW